MENTFETSLKGSIFQKGSHIFGPSTHPSIASDATFHMSKEVEPVAKLARREGHHVVKCGVAVVVVCRGGPRRRTLRQDVCDMSSQNLLSGF